MSALLQKPPSIFGGILLIIGNVIGAGILALPLATAQLGLPAAIALLLFFWLLMMLGAYYFLEANLAFPAGSNFISMSRITLGKPGMVIAWICYLLVMYSLISAYIAGGGDLIKINFYYLGITLPSWASSVFFLLIFGFVVFRGIYITDYTNRILMLAKAIIFFITVMGIAMHFNFYTIPIISQKNLSSSLLIVAITSFGFATLIPSLRTYYNSDVQKIKKIIFWGTLIPFLCYVAWVTVIFSVIPYYGVYGLAKISTSTHPVSDLQYALKEALQISWLIQATNIFSAICVITSFLANSISLSDFLADGLAIHKNQNNRWLIYLIAYLPAICVVIFYQKAFLLGLSIAGTLAIIQLLILPGMIVWFLRYSDIDIRSNYAVMGGKFLLIMMLIISFFLLVWALL